MTTDDAGLTPEFDKPGTYGAQVRRAEAQAGERDGKKFDEVRRYATVVVTLPGQVTPCPTRSSALSNCTRVTGRCPSSAG